jgi:hypothetical protein
MKYIVLTLACLLLAAISAPAAEENMFPFVISYDAPDNATNISSWQQVPAGKQGFVRAEDGHLDTDAGPIRFWGTNLCFKACFPTREQAERGAARLARLGVNCVRLHHMDMRDIWGDSPNKLTIDPDPLDRLDYLIAQLKARGIYVNINLHVSRTLGEAEGFPNPGGRPNYDKGVGNFEPRMIEAQKAYARDLLTHVNPYTKTAYTDEPAVAFVEISNEDALYAVWNWGQLDDLPDPYATTFRKQWNGWLRETYGSTEKLKAAWNVGRRELGEELLANGDFSKPLDQGWHLELAQGAEAQWAIQKGGPDGQLFLRVRVEKLGRVSWLPQFQHSGFAVKKGEPYTFTFRLRASNPGRITVNCMMAHEPWNHLGLGSSIQVTKEWKPYRLTFVANASDPEARVTFTSLDPGTTYELADVSLRAGGIIGVEPGQSLEDSSIPVVKKGQMNVTEAARSDWADFLWDTERDYWLGMYRFLKDDLGVKSLVAGTQLSYSPVHVQAKLDYVDAHSYWQHPHFPGRPWDSRNWFVNNVALVNQPGGTLAGLAERRVAGMAFTVSEYNHPAPNQYAAEGFPMLAAFGAFQQWDGLFPFAYCHNERWEPRRIESYFDIKSHTPKIAHMIACAALFRRGDAAQAQDIYMANLSRERERKRLRETLNAWGLTAGELGLDERLSLLHAIGLNITDEAEPKSEPRPIPDDQKVFVSDTGELRWDLSQKGAGVFTADTPRTKLFTGFVRGRTFELGKVALTIGETQLDWATVTLTCIDGEGFDRPGRILIAATGACHNTGADLASRGGNRVWYDKGWGSEPVLCEGIPAEITLPAPAGKVQLYPLDERGDRKTAIPVTQRDGQALLRLGPEHKTVWYEAVVK